MTTIGLCMIVKDEAGVISRCMNSVAPWIDTWTIVDTGSTDDTPSVIEATADALGITGRLYHRPWVNFGHNRSEAIALAREHSDYLLIIDADEVLQWAGDSRPMLSHDAYSYTMVHGDIRYQRAALVATRLPWRYEGVLHEYLECGTAITPEPLAGLSVLYGYDGARTRNPNKFLDDAKLLEAAVAAEPDNARYWFYLAQSWRDAGRLDDAICCYTQRAKMVGWDEEQWYAQYQIASLKARRGDDLLLVSDAFQKAYELRPQRAETLVWWAFVLRQKAQWHSALLLLKTAFALPNSTDSLFVEPDCYGWRCADELALTLFYTNRKSDAQKAWEVALQLGCPADAKLRIEENITKCINK